MFFAMRAQDAEVTDPQPRLLLKLIWKCIECYSQVHLSGSNTGTYVGTICFIKMTKCLIPHRILSTSDHVLANRIAFEY